MAPGTQFLGRQLDSGFERLMVAAIDSVFLEILLVSMLASFAVCALNIVTEHWHGSYSFDADVRGIQKVHKKRVPRTGGIGLLSGIAALSLLGSLGYLPLPIGEEGRVLMGKLLLASVPAFLAGILEDLTKTVSVRTRFFSILASALLAAWLLGARLPRLDLWGIDGLLALLPVSLAVTLFAVTGVTNSINIVDGFHGLAGSTVMIVLAGTGYLAWKAGDPALPALAVAGIGATAGFLMLNYPTGRLFMGDGGAYLLGFWAAELAVLTVARNPSINAWQVLAIFAYPVIEVLFSIYRRKILRGTRVGIPDRLHLHSLLYRRIARQRIGTGKFHWMGNAGVACLVAPWLASASAAAILIGDATASAVALVALQVLVYIAIYMRLVRGHWGHCRSPAVILGLRPQPRSRLA